MSFIFTQTIRQFRTDYKRLLALVIELEMQDATIDQMERGLFRQVLCLGSKLL